MTHVAVLIASNDPKLLETGKSIDRIADCLVRTRGKQNCKIRKERTANGAVYDAVVDWLGRHEFATDDVLVIMFAGHGAQTGKGGWTFGDEGRVWVWTPDTLATLIRDTRAKRVVVISASCYATLIDPKIPKEERELALRTAYSNQTRRWLRALKRETHDIPADITYLFASSRLGLVGNNTLLLFSHLIVGNEHANGTDATLYADFRSLQQSASFCMDPPAKNQSSRRSALGGTIR